MNANTRCIAKHLPIDLNNARYMTLILPYMKANFPLAIFIRRLRSSRMRLGHVSVGLRYP